MKKKKHFHFICCTLAEPMMLMLMLKNSLAIMHRPGGLGEGEGVGHFLQSVFATIPALQPLSTVQIGHIYIYAHLTEIVKGTYWHQCQLDVDTQSLAFQATIGHCSEEKNKYAHRLSQLTSKSEFKYTSFTALQYTFPMDNVQDCKIA